MQTITLSQEQFDRARAALHADHDVTLAEKSPTEGTVETVDVLFSYYFDGSVLRIDMLKKKSLKAKLASDGVICGHIEDLLEQAS